MQKKPVQSAKVRIKEQFLSITMMKALRYMRRRWKRILLLVVIAAPVLALARFLTYVAPAQYLTEKVQRGDLVQSVEVVATVISEKDLELKFPVSGIVDELLVADGDVVVAGQELAKLRSGSLKAAVTAAQARLTTAYAELRALEEGARPEDIAIAEAELRNKQSSLELARSKYDTAVASLEKANSKLQSLQAEADTALVGQLSSAWSAFSKDLSLAKTAISVIEDVYADVTLQNILVQEQPAEYAEMNAERKRVFATVNSVIAQYVHTPDDYHVVISALQQAQSAISSAAMVVQHAYDFIAKQEALGLFSYSKKESLKGTLAVQKTYVENALVDSTTILQSLQDKVASYETRITTEEANLVSARGSRDQALNDISTYQTAVQISQAQLDLNKAGSRQTDIDGAKGRVQSARADLQKAQADYDDTILKAPIDGTITKVNLKEGEFTPGQFSETVPAITILGVSPYRIEVFTSEIDIPKIKYGQTGSLLLDAYAERPFVVTVSEIDPAATVIDGVPKYRVKLDFVEDNDALFKIGMTGDLDIITNTKEDVLYISGRAVIKNDAGQKIVRILQDNDAIDQRPVSTGMETVTDIEITDGIKEGETVIVLTK